MWVGSALDPPRQRMVPTREQSLNQWPISSTRFDSPASEHHETLAFRDLLRLGQQPGLAHSGLTGEQHSLTSTARRGVDCGRQYRELCAARNQRKVGGHICILI